jgi:hypothetical protein
MPCSILKGWLMYSIAMAVLLVVTAESPVRGEILVQGLFHEEEVQAHSGESWLCLFSTSAQEELRQCTIEVKRAYDPVSEDNSGKEVSLRGGGNALVLARNLPMLRPGPVRTYFLGTAPVRPETHLEVGGNRQLKIWLQPEKESYALVLSDGESTQILRGAPAYDTEGRPPTLLWAGDMDKDGKLDLLMDITNHYNVSEIALFLSSLAGSGELVGNAGKLRSVGC